MQILGPLAAFFAWSLLTQLSLFYLRPVVGIPLAAGLFLAFLYLVVVRAGRPGEARRRALLRLRPLTRATLGATIRAIPVILVLSWAIGEVWLRLVPVPRESLAPFAELTDTPSERLRLALYALVAAPLLEEFIFRGVVQHRLERLWGPAPAIFVAAAVFALFHWLPWVLPVHLFLGLAFGYAVWATRSIWTGVLLHAANNSVAMLALGAEPAPPDTRPTVWQTGPDADLWTALAVLALASAAGVWAARRLREAGRVRG